MSHEPGRLRQRTRQAVLLEYSFRVLLQDSHLYFALLLGKSWRAMTSYHHCINPSQSRINRYVACPIRAIVGEDKLIFMTWCGYLRSILSVFGIILSHYHPITLISVTAEEILSALPGRRAQPLLVLHQD